MNKVYPYLIFGLIITSVLVEIQKSEIEAIQKDNVIISFSFDDNFKTHIMALNEMQKYGYNGTIGIIVGSLNVNQNYTLTIDDINRFKSSGWEIASHSMLHKDMSKIDEEQIEYELSESKKFFEKINISVDTYIYPSGKINDTIARITKKYYNIGRATCFNDENNVLIYRKGLSYDQIEKQCINTNNISDLKIKSIGLSDRVYSPEELKSLLSSANYQKQPVWLDFHFHKIVDNVTQSNFELSSKNFKEILKIMKDGNITVRTIKDGHDLFEEKQGPQ